ncbi:MAG: heavy metal sensor histidine kinase [Bryobacteraceae bacterium]
MRPLKSIALLWGARPLGLRLRLTVIYVALLALLVLGLGVLFRQTLRNSQRETASALLAEEWSAVRAYLKVQGGQPVWTFDKDDAYETSTVQQLRSVFLLTDRSGKVLEISEDYKDLRPDPPDEIARILKLGKQEETIRTDPDGYTYLLRSGLFLSDGRKEYFLSVGRSMDADLEVVRAFTRKYFSVTPLIIFVVSLASWWMAGRALQPLQVVAQAAHSITSENLGLSIPRRGTDDELDHLIDAFNNMVDRLENSFNQMRQFSSDVSHELRTPLTAIRGQLEVALFTGRTPEQYREAMAAAIEDVDHLSHIVRALLHLSQAESGQVTLARDPVDLSRMASSVVEQFEIPAEVEGLALRSHLEPACIVQGDRLQIERLVSNLVSNAVKYTPRGGTVDIRVNNTEAGVELKVEDTGCGIAPEHLPHIFERLYRVPDGSRNPERGLGLGLSFVAWIVKAHGAQIKVDSVPGKGSCFTVTFAPEIVPVTTAPAGEKIVA